MKIIFIDKYKLQEPSNREMYYDYINLAYLKMDLFSNFDKNVMVCRTLINHYQCFYGNDLIFYSNIFLK